MAVAVWKQYKGHEIRWVSGGRGGNYELYLDGNYMQIRCRKTAKGWVIESYHRNQNKWEKLFDTYFNTRAQAMNKTVRDEVSLWYD